MVDLPHPGGLWPDQPVEDVADRSFEVRARQTPLEQAKDVCLEDACGDKLMCAKSSEMSTDTRYASTIFSAKSSI